MANSKRERAEQMEPNRFKMSVAPQPIPGAPQGKGNMMNNPQVGESFNPQIGSLSGINLHPYGDSGVKVSNGRLGAVGFVGNSGQPQNMVMGRGQNRGAPYGSTPSPNNMQSEQMLASNMAESAAMFGAKLNQVDGKPSYKVQPGLGMSGNPPFETMPGGIPPTMPGQLQSKGPQGALPLQGSPDAQGMSMGRGGGRNKPSKA